MAAKKTPQLPADVLALARRMGVKRPAEALKRYGARQIAGQSAVAPDLFVHQGQKPKRTR